MKKRNLMTALFVVMALLFSACEQPTSPETPDAGSTVDKTALTQAISDAEVLLARTSVGSDVGNISQAAYDDYETAIESAKTVAGYSNPSQTEIDAAVTDLATATAAFNIMIVGPPIELVVNGDFATALGSEWSKYEASGAVTISEASGELVANITASSGATYDPKVFQDGIQLISGKTYVVSFDARADVARSIQVNVGLQVGSAPWYYDFMGAAEVRHLTTTMETYTFSFTSDNQGQTTGDIIFELGAGATTSVYIDNVSIMEKPAFVDFYELNYAVTEANTLYTNTPEGTTEGTALAADRLTFSNAISAADAIAQNPASTQVEVDSALTNLTSAIATFNASIIGPMVKNGDFTVSDPYTNWSIYNGGGSDYAMSVASEELVISGTTVGANSYEPKVYQTNLPLVDGTTYTVSFDAKADVARDIAVNIGLQVAADPWFYSFMNNNVETVSLTTSWQTFTFTFTSANQGQTTGDLIFELGNGVATTIYLDNISISE